MHNLHFLQVQAGSASDAAATAERLIADWGDENNWRSIGGVASENGEDDLENADGGRWGLSDLPDGPGTAYTRALEWVRLMIADPIHLEYPPFTECPTLGDALSAVARSLEGFDPEQGAPIDLWFASRNVRQLHETVTARRRQAADGGLVELYPWKLDHFGLTDLSEHSDGTQHYLVLLDMHS